MTRKFAGMMGKHKPHLAGFRCCKDVPAAAKPVAGRKARLDATGGAAQMGYDKKGTRGTHYYCRYSRPVWSCRAIAHVYAIIV